MFINMEDIIRESLLKRYNQGIGEYKDDVIAIGILETVLNFHSDNELIDLKDYDLVSRLKLGVSESMLKPNMIIRTGFYKNKNGEFVAFKIEYIGDNRQRYTIKTNSREYVKEHNEIFWD